MTALPLLLLLQFICGIKPILGFSLSPILPRTSSSSRSSTRQYAINDDEISRQLADKDNPLAETSRLSHVMLRVPSVDDTVNYWTTIQGGSIRVSRPNKNDDDKNDNDDADINNTNGLTQKLTSAMVELGCHDEDGNPKGSCFALELVSTTTNKKNNRSKHEP